MMHYNPEKHHRHSIPLKGYDYTQVGAYFITICTQDRSCLFGEVLDGGMHVAERRWAHGDRRMGKVAGTVP
jgi:hypothetical protein